MAGAVHQKNKAHKAGRRAGKGVRGRNQDGKLEQRKGGASSASAQGKAARQQQAAAARRAARSQVHDRLRHAHAPLVVQLLPTSTGLDSQALWNGLVRGCRIGSEVAKLDSQTDAEPTDLDDNSMEADETTADEPMVMQTILVPGRYKIRVTLLPPPSEEDRLNPMVLVDMAKAADVTALCVPIHPGEPLVDGTGKQCLQILRTMGLPHPVVLLQNAGTTLKDRAASKKATAAAFSSQLPGDHSMWPVDRVSDCVQLLRGLVEAKIEAPLWRRNRPQVMIERAEYEAKVNQPGASDSGTLWVSGYIRGVGMSANQLLTVPGAGDCEVGRIEAGEERVTGGGFTSAAGTVLALPDGEREGLTRENVPEDGLGEQTWPSEAEMMDADSQARRVLPKGTSDYQACWIDQEDDGTDDDIEAGNDDDEVPMAMDDANCVAGGTSAPSMMGDDDDDGMSIADPDEDPAVRSANLRRLRGDRHREAQDDDLDFPDEMETPHDMTARNRFQKFRGLKSFRTSKWDSKEGLPEQYSRVFAFQNFTRAKKRAVEHVQRVLEGTEPGCVAAGTFVRIALVNVSPETAASVIHRSHKCYPADGRSACSEVPLVASALLPHEVKLSVVNMGVRKAEEYGATIINKEDLIFVTGLRTFSARPIISSDDYSADKFKMERFLHPGRASVMSVYAPISYPPLPVLVLKADPDGGVPTIAATGAVRSCDPDRIVLKKVILTGYPLKVHKKKAIVRYMFFHPEDIRWFKPLELWTKYGRRGRIKESVGMHGSMKCIFDAPLNQRDSICMSLYKRVFPKWPEDMKFSLDIRTSSDLPVQEDSTL